MELLHRKLYALHMACQVSQLVFQMNKELQIKIFIFLSH